jgi:hypothetical protein
MLLLVTFCFNVKLLVVASSVKLKGVVVDGVVLGLRRTTVVCVNLAVVGSVEERIVEEVAVEETEVVVVRTVVVIGVVVVRTVVVMGVVVVRTIVVIVVVDDRSVVPVVKTVVRLVVTRGVVVAVLGVVEGRVTGLVVRAFMVTGKERGVAGVVVRTVVLCVVVF